MGFPSLDRAPSPPPLSPFSSFIFFPTCFEDNGLLFWLPDVLCQPTEVVLWSLLSVEMFFWGICEGESGLHVLFLCHLRTAPPFLTLNTSCHSIRPAVSAQRSSDDLMGIPLYIIIFYLVAFNVFSLSVFIHLITICLGVFLLGFVLPETLYTSCTWVPISFLMWGRFSAVISSNIRDVCNMNTGALNAVPEISLKIFIYFHFFFILFCSSDFHHSIFLLTYPFFCLICSAIYSSIF